MRGSMNNTIYIKKSKLDQFYTNTDVANMCYEKIWKFVSKRNFNLFLEPFAGSGSFFNLMPKTKRVGLDLEPKADFIIKTDFFDYVAPENKKIITITNPAFGKNCSIATKAFNKAAEFSIVIAMIIPKTFRKQSLQNKLNLNFKLVFDMDLPKNSFILNNEPYDVPCCFQIWQKSESKRDISIVDLNNNYFDFTIKSDSDFAIRRVGGRAGKAFLDVAKCSNSSNYFLKFKKNKLDDFIKKVNNVDFSSISNSTAGVRSISKQELISKLREEIVDF